jgi:hypothetical protein
MSELDDSLRPQFQGDPAHLHHIGRVAAADIAAVGGLGQLQRPERTGNSLTPGFPNPTISMRYPTWNKSMSNGWVLVCLSTSGRWESVPQNPR